MSIIRISKRPRYTVIDNRLIEDNRLDYDHVGLLTYLLSKRSNWNVSILHLSKQKNSGKSKITRLLKDLQQFGYAKYFRLSNGKTEWIIYENPQPENQVEDTEPQPEKPDVEKPHVANQPLVITEKESKDLNNSKKEKEKKETPLFKKIDLSDLDKTISANAMQEFINFKIKKTKVFSQSQFDRACKKILKLASSLNKEPDWVIYETIDAGWQGLGAVEWYQNRIGKAVIQPFAQNQYETTEGLSWD